ncbi:flagellar biosynthetic protein FliR [Poseidonocella sp. HB161398]|uniref:flagellar biosynthetic protein FliR n=1 Tax=Poseidonocella sp. HB161398 TaxID=2320855 RepID=UPI0011091264|nr:flagellar biosynthetic protein FliR [Poseidonocella sp. HB161398]
MTLEEAVLAILDALPAELWFLVLLRVGGVVALLPMLGSRVVPTTLRLAFALALTLVLAPLAGEFSTSRNAPLGDYVDACAAELLTGLLIGFLCRCLFWSIQLAGTMASQSISLAQLMGAQIDQPQASIGQVLYLGALALAVVLNFHLVIVDAMIDSFDLVPLGTGVPAALAAELSAESAARAFEIGFALSCPFLVVAVLYNLCLGVVNKAMPQLMVAFIGAPAISWLGIALLFVSAPILLKAWSEHLLAFSLREGLR